MASSLPNNPSLDRLRRDARTLQRGVRAQDSRAFALVRTHHPGPTTALADAPASFALHDAQLVVARGYGFSGWPALVHYLRLADGLRVDPGQIPDDGLDLADRFCALSVLRYDHTDSPSRRQQAAAMWAEHPGLSEQHIWSAAAASDVPTLRRLLSSNPGTASTPGGPYGWEPLLYLCYSRVELGRTEADVLEAMALLLDAGADPDAGYLWCGLATPFTALTGVFGEGEQGPERQPRHRYADALASQLLARGAWPEDHQSIYNRMFRPDNDHLRLLFAHGLGQPAQGPWQRRLGEAMESAAQMWDRQLEWAERHGFDERLEILAHHGIRPRT